MAENWCSEHGVAFFKKGGMKGYAHPIGDTGKWCNKPKEADTTEEPSPESMGPQPRPQASPEVAPQERGMWYKEVGEWMRTGQLDKWATEGRIPKDFAKVLREAYWINMKVGTGIKPPKKTQDEA